MSGILEGRKALIFGVANDRSIAWAVARELHAQGAELAFTYAGEVLEKARPGPLAEGIGSTICLPCDRPPGTTRSRRSSRRSAGGGAALDNPWCNAHPPSPRRKDLSQPYVQTGREGVSHTALDISSYSLVALTRHAAGLMKGRGGGGGDADLHGVREGGAQLQNVMGVAKAALEASVRYPRPRSRSGGDTGQTPSRPAPVKTLAASGIAGFRDMLHLVSEKAPAQAQRRPGRNRQDRRLPPERPREAAVTGEDAPRRCRLQRDGHVKPRTRACAGRGSGAVPAPQEPREGNRERDIAAGSLRCDAGGWPGRLHRRTHGGGVHRRPSRRERSISPSRFSTPAQGMAFNPGVRRSGGEVTSPGTGSCCWVARAGPPIQQCGEPPGAARLPGRGQRARRVRRLCVDPLRAGAGRRLGGASGLPVSQDNGEGTSYESLAAETGLRPSPALRPPSPRGRGVVFDYSDGLLGEGFFARDGEVTVPSVT